MRIACLILAHQGPNHLRRLLASLESDNVDIYVHLDRKSRLSPDIGCGTKAVFLENRINVWWGDYSIVEATLALLAHALKRSNYDYVLLLSGSDYPIVSTAHMLDFFKNNQGKEFINITSMPNCELGKLLERLTAYRFNYKSSGQAGLWFLSRLNARLAKSPFPRDYRKFLGGLLPFAGSQWWALSGDACRYVLEFVEKHHRLVAFYRNTLIPDEMFFQTIIGNSAFAGRVVHSVTFADWSKFGPPYPALINTWHIEKFIDNRPFRISDGYGQGEALFARKFADDSESLVSQIDRILRQQNR